MENSSVITEYKKSIQYLLCTAHSTGKQWAFFSAINCFFSITAIFSNLLVLVTLHKASSLHPPSKRLYRCLAVTDLLVGLISEPSFAVYEVVLAQENHLTDLCFYIGTVCVVSFTTLSAVSLLTMTTISLDRLLALLLGLRYRHIVTLRRVRALLTLYWFLSVGFALMTIWEVTFGKVYNYALISICIFVSLFCYSKILFALRLNQTQQAQRQQREPNGGETPFNIARYRKTVTTAIWVQITLIACYLPYGIVIAIITIHGSSPFLDVMWEITSSLVCLNSSLNPLLYCWRIQEVKQEVKNTIRQLFSCCLSN